MTKRKQTRWQYGVAVLFMLLCAAGICAVATWQELRPKPSSSICRDVQIDPGCNPMIDKDGCHNFCGRKTLDQNTDPPPQTDGE